MAEYMLLLAKDPELAQRMGMAARQRIEMHYSMEKSVDALWGIIRGAINSVY